LAMLVPAFPPAAKQLMVSKALNRPSFINEHREGCDVKAEPAISLRRAFELSALTTAPCTIRP